MIDDDAYAELQEAVARAAAAIRELRRERDQLLKRVQDLRLRIEAADADGRSPGDPSPSDPSPGRPSASVAAGLDPAGSESPGETRIALLEREREAVRSRLRALHTTLSRLGAAEALVTGASADDGR